MRPGGTLLFMGGTGGRRVGHGLGIVVGGHGGAAPVRRRPGAGGRAGPGQPHRAPASWTPRCRPSLLGDQLEARRDELRATLPIGRVVGPADVAALAVHIMSNTALAGATYDIDGGQQFVW